MSDRDCCVSQSMKIQNKNFDNSVRAGRGRGTLQRGAIAPGFQAWQSFAPQNTGVTGDSMRKYRRFLAKIQDST